WGGDYITLQASLLGTRSKFHLAFQVKDASAFQLHAIAHQPANNFPAARRRLKCSKRLLAQSLCPVRRQHAMRAPGHRIFGDALRWREVSAHKIVRTISQRSHDHSVAIHLGEE